MRRRHHRTVIRWPDRRRNHQTGAISIRRRTVALSHLVQLTVDFMLRRGGRAANQGWHGRTSASWEANVWPVHGRVDDDSRARRRTSACTRCSMVYASVTTRRSSVMVSVKANCTGVDARWPCPARPRCFGNRMSRLPRERGQADHSRPYASLCCCRGSGLLYLPRPRRFTELTSGTERLRSP